MGIFFVLKGGDEDEPGLEKGGEAVAMKRYY
jgi:hypothetical protein